MCDDRTVKLFEYCCAVITVAARIDGLLGKVVEQELAAAGPEFTEPPHDLKLFEHDLALLAVPLDLGESL